jgi:hypothetical protein
VTATPVTQADLDRVAGNLAAQLHELRLWVAELRVALADLTAGYRADSADVWARVGDLSNRLSRLEGKP